MIGETIVFMCAVSLVTSYLLIVNRLLRTDEHWSESTATPAPEPVANRRREFESPAHA